jgi:hypothetical protein
MWEPQRLTNLWAFTAYYRDSFTCFLLTVLTNSRKMRFVVWFESGTIVGDSASDYLSLCDVSQSSDRICYSLGCPTCRPGFYTRLGYMWSVVDKVAIRVGRVTTLAESRSISCSIFITHHSTLTASLDNELKLVHAVLPNRCQFEYPICGLCNDSISCSGCIV